MINIKNITIEKDEDNKYITKGLLKENHKEILINLDLNKELVNQIIEIIVKKINDGEQIINKYFFKKFSRSM